MKKVNWHWDYGYYMPFCPHCNEPAYEQDHCVFCGKRFKWIEGKHKPSVVEHNGYKAVQGTGNDIVVYDEEGEPIMYSSCARKYTERELKYHIEYVIGIREGRSNESKNTK